MTDCLLVEKFYTAWELSPSNAGNNLCFYYKFNDKNILDSVVTALSQLVNINSELRKNFYRDSFGKLCASESAKIYSCKNLAVTSEARAMQLIAELAKFVPNLNHDLLIQTSSIFVEETKEYWLFFHIHHILLDGAGLKTFINGLNQQLATSKPVILPVITSTKSILTVIDELGLDSYLDDLANCIEENQNVIIENTDTFYQSVELNSKLISKIDELSKMHGFSRFNILLLIYSLFVAKINNSNSSLVLYPVNMRKNSDGLGCAVNSIVYPFIFAADETLIDKIKIQKEQLSVYKKLSLIDIISFSHKYQVPLNIPAFADSQMAQLPLLANAKSYSLPQLSSSPYVIKYTELDNKVYMYFETYVEAFSDTLLTTILDRFVNFCTEVVSQPNLSLSSFDLIYSDSPVVE